MARIIDQYAISAQSLTAGDNRVRPSDTSRLRLITTTVACHFKLAIDSISYRKPREDR